MVPETIQNCISLSLFYTFCSTERFFCAIQQNSIPVGCVLPAYQPYVFRWRPLDVSTVGGWVGILRGRYTYPTKVYNYSLLVPEIPYPLPSEVTCYQRYLQHEKTLPSPQLYVADTNETVRIKEVVTLAAAYFSLLMSVLARPMYMWLSPARDCSMLV